MTSLAVKKYITNQTQFRFSFLLCSNKVNDYLYSSINSCLLQTFKDYELIIVLNGEAANFFEQLKKKYLDKKIKILKTDIKYLTNALNVGLEVCSGEYIVRIDADDINFIDRLERVNSLLEESDNMTKMVFSDFEYIDSRDNKFSRHKKASNIKSIYYKNPIPHPTVVINREFLLELGGYQGFIYSEDYELWVRLVLNQGMSAITQIHSPTIYYRSDVTGLARGSKMSYAGQASCQIYAFMMTFDIRWLIGFFFTFFKGIFCGK